MRTRQTQKASQHNLFIEPLKLRSRADILADLRRLAGLHKDGLLGGEKMPEDARPPLPADSEQLLVYLTLPMALNYQRNSYRLWESATRTYVDNEAAWVFDPNRVAIAAPSLVRENLLKHKLALQPEKHTATWIGICKTLSEKYSGSVEYFLRRNEFSVKKILAALNGEDKKGFPYLSGQKISNYWLYVVHSYTDFKLVDLHELSVAPDTHVIQSSERLGVISLDELSAPNAQAIVSERWRDLLAGTEINPIDIHTPLWLWSRAGFPDASKALRSIARADKS
jgi:hypothetical protein